FSKKCLIKAPTWSLPTPVSRAVFNPSLVAPTAILVGHPPTKALNAEISVKGLPTLAEYRSIEDRPMVSRSYFFCMLIRKCQNLKPAIWNLIHFRRYHREAGILSFPGAEDPFLLRVGGVCQRLIAAREKVKIIYIVSMPCNNRV